MLAATAPVRGDSAWVLDFLQRSDAARMVRDGRWSLRYRTPDGWALTTREGLAIIISGDVEDDGRRWLHISLSYRDRLPSYAEMTRVKERILGPDREAYQVFPRASRHINIHEHCLHLWHCVDATPLPDFTRGGAPL